jgi:hypothetical protein
VKNGIATAQVWRSPDLGAHRNNEPSHLSQQHSSEIDFADFDDYAGNTAE